MDIGQIAAQASADQGNTSANSTSNQDLGQSEFLQLLVTQMQNQDPINPMDGKQFASQLAQFNSVEQLVNVNDGLSSLQESQQLMRTEMTNSMAASLTGKNVRALGNQVSLGSSGNADINYKLNNAADEVEIVIKDSSGNKVRTETLDGGTSGQNTWTWDGTSNEGVPMSQGNYNVEINASNGDKNVESNMFIEGTTDRVRFTGQGVRISIDGVEVPIGNIETVESK